MEWNAIIKTLREEKGLNQTEFGELFGVSQKVISNWEQGRNQPNIETLVKIANYFHTSVDYLVGRIKEE